jgi:hypothetical protein
MKRKRRTTGRTRTPTTRSPHGIAAAIGGFFGSLFGGRAAAEDEEAETDPAQPGAAAQDVRAVSNRRSVMETALRNSGTKQIDIDLGPDALPAQPGKAEPIEPVVIGPGGTFGMNPLEAEKAAAPSLDPFAPLAQPAAPDVILPAGGNAAAPVSAAAGTAPAASAPGPAVLTPEPAAADEGWISIGDEPAPESSIDSLTAAAMAKPAAAESAAAPCGRRGAPAARGLLLPAAGAFRRAQGGAGPRRPRRAQGQRGEARRHARQLRRQDAHDGYFPRALRHPV